MPSNPISPPIGYGATGVTTVVWGTDGLALFGGAPVDNSAAQAGFAGTGYYVLTDYRQNLKKDMDYGENGSGVQVRRTAIIHGQTWNITVEDDSNMTPPNYGTTIKCYDIMAKGTSTGIGAPAIVGKLIWTAVIVDSEYTAVPKKPGTRIILAENLTFVDSQA